ncbi:MAG: hypothetical protein ISS34_05040 [Candidatus Omnitrophica bacterium]|nr:hypothetical protein [Candidatus Omnitrophota bacterium]
MKAVIDAQHPKLAVEVAFRGDRDEVLRLIKLASKRSKESSRRPIVAAGTVLNGLDAAHAQLNGAQLIVTPGLTLNEDKISALQRLGAKVIMGVGSLQEALDAKQRGADAIKVFPYNPKGDHMRALKGPLPRELHELADKYVEITEDGYYPPATFTNVYEFLSDSPTLMRAFALPRSGEQLVEQIKMAVPGLPVVITGGVSIEKVEEGLLTDLGVGAALSIKSLDDVSRLSQALPNTTDASGAAPKYRPVAVTDFLRNSGVCGLISPSGTAETLMEAIIDAQHPGLAVEVAFRGDRREVLRLIDLASKRSKENSRRPIVAAGTVLNGEDALEAKLEGAQLIVTPGLTLSEGEIAEVQMLGAKVIMGVGTLEEALIARQRGANAIKVFPYNPKGDHMKALKGPLPKDFHVEADRYVEIMEEGGYPYATFSEILAFLRSNPKEKRKFLLPTCGKVLVAEIREVITDLPIIITGGVSIKEVEEGLLIDLGVGAALSIKEPDDISRLRQTLPGATDASGAAPVASGFTPEPVIEGLPMSVSPAENGLLPVLTTGAVSPVSGRVSTGAVVYKEGEIAGREKVDTFAGLLTEALPVQEDMTARHIIPREVRGSNNDSYWEGTEDTFNRKAGRDDAYAIESLELDLRLLMSVDAGTALGLIKQHARLHNADEAGLTVLYLPESLIDKLEEEGELTELWRYATVVPYRDIQRQVGVFAAPLIGCGEVLRNVRIVKEKNADANIGMYGRLFAYLHQAVTGCEERVDEGVLELIVRDIFSLLRSIVLEFPPMTPELERRLRQDQIRYQQRQREAFEAAIAV